MKRTKKILCLLLACAAVFSSTLTALAQIENIDGKDHAYVSSFGRLSYEGKPKTAFKNLNDALNGLSGGGKVIVQGNYTIDSLLQKGDLEIVGTGTKATGNKLSFPSGKIELTGALSLSNLCIDMPENGTVVTNGNDFKAFDGFDSWSVEKYAASSANTITYPAPISVTAGNFEKSSVIELLSGKYKTISAGSGNGRIQR